MKYAIEVVPFGEFADPRAVVELAVAAEEAGWDGLFTWDHVAIAAGIPTGEPFATLAAVAASTERIRLGTNVTVVPRRAPHLLAHTVAALDLLSNGRVILGVGAGGPEREFTAFGQPASLSVRAEMLDEGLTIVDGLLSGNTVVHGGPHYTVDRVALSPRPVQTPRPPIWIGGLSRPALRRAARYDGWVLYCADQSGGVQYPPGRLARSLEYLRRHRAGDRPFDVAVNGQTGPDDASLPREYESAGATWWLESLHGYRGDRQKLLERVKAGPPR